MSLDNDLIKSLSQQIVGSYGTDPALRKYRDRASQGLRKWEETVVRQAFPDEGKIAVIGCGAGRELFALRARRYTVHGFDVTRRLLLEARALTEEGSRLVQMMGAHLPLRDQTVDAVTLWSQLLGNVPGHRQRRALLSEAWRVLRPGGMVSFSVHDRDRTLPLLDSEKTSNWDEPEAGDLMLREDDEETTRYWHYFNRDEVIQLCHEAGFTTPDVCFTTDLGERWGNVLVAVASK